MKKRWGIILLLLASCSNFKRIERKASRGDVNACDLLVHLLEEEQYFNGKNDRIQKKIYYYSKKCILLDTGNWYKGYHYLELANSPYTETKQQRNDYSYKAALFGESEGQYFTAINYLDGRTRPMNKDSALYWCKMATTGNYSKYQPLACMWYADMLYEGKLLPADTLAALYYYKKACALFNSESSVAACDSVINYYKRKHLKDSTEQMIYEEIAAPLRKWGIQGK